MNELMPNLGARVSEMGPLEVDGLEDLIEIKEARITMDFELYIYVKTPWLLVGKSGDLYALVKDFTIFITFTGRAHVSPIRTKYQEKIRKDYPLIGQNYEEKILTATLNKYIRSFKGSKRSFRGRGEHITLSVYENALTMTHYLNRWHGRGVYSEIPINEKDAVYWAWFLTWMFGNNFWNKVKLGGEGDG